jgi:hypothetical protein
VARRALGVAALLAALALPGAAAPLPEAEARSALDAVLPRAEPAARQAALERITDAQDAARDRHAVKVARERLLGLVRVVQDPAPEHLAVGAEHLEGVGVVVPPLFTVTSKS